jgi:hypothetical protein
MMMLLEFVGKNVEVINGILGHYVETNAVVTSLMKKQEFVGANVVIMKKIWEHYVAKNVSLDFKT